MCLCSMLQFTLEYGAVLILVKFVSLEAVLSTRVWWRCTVVDSGELCVIIHLVKLMLTLYVDSWDMREHFAMTTSACEKCVVIFTQRPCSLLMHCCSRGNSSQPIWLDNVPCSSSDVCLADCINCPSNENCEHYEDITVECCESCTCNHYSSLVPMLFAWAA